jgi:hypothetical protein
MLAGRMLERKVGSALLMIQVFARVVAPRQID